MTNPKPKLTANPPAHKFKRRLTRQAISLAVVALLLAFVWPVLGQDPPAPADIATEAAASRSLWGVILDGGIIGLLIIILSMVAIGFVVEHTLSLRRESLLPDEVMRELEAQLETGNVDEAIRYCEAVDESLLTEVVKAGLLRYKASPFGHLELRAAMEEAGEEQTARLYRKTEVLGLIGSISPMLGLTGTVLGMITAFNTLADTGGTARPDQLAGGIGQALVTTLLGLVVAIPSMVAFTYFRNRIDSIVAEAGKRIELLMSPLAQQRK